MSQVPKSAGPPAFLFKAPRQPMLWAAIAYALGIVAGTYAWRPVLWWVVGAAAFVAAAAYFIHRRTWLAAGLGFGALFFVGALQIQLRGSSTPLDISIQQYADGQELRIVAHVIADGRLRESAGQETAQSVDVEAENIETESGQDIPVRCGIRLSLYSQRINDMRAEPPSALPTTSDLAQRIFHYGERIRFYSKLKPPHNFRNPGAFDYSKYLAAHGIAALGSTKASGVETLDGFVGNPLERWRTRIHRNVVAKVHELWSPRDAGLIDAMVIGEEAFIDRDTRADFQRSGTYHVLVVSGMNVSILAFVVFWTLHRLRVGDIPATLLTIFFCVGYALLTDVGAPVWRATLMCAIYLGTRLLYRDRAMVNALGAAALGLLVVDPAQLFTASFQMTFVCVLIVAAIALPILERTSQLYKRAWANWDSIDYARALPPSVAQLRVDLQLIAARLARFVGDVWAVRCVRATMKFCFGAFELLFISAVMQMGLALPMAYYFHRATTVGLPANIVVVPLTELMMPAAIASVGLGFISPWLAKIPVLLTVAALHGITGTVRGLSALQLADLRVATPALAMIVAASITLAGAMLLARRRLLFSTGGLAAILLSALALALITPPPKVHAGLLEMTSIDVGEGDSTLVISPQGRTLLVDAGGPVGPGGSQLDYGEDVVSPYLWSRGISRLDAVAITHGHSDHIGGMGAVLKNFRPTELWVGLLPPSRPLESLIAEAQNLGIKVVRRWEGDAFDFGGAAVSVLYPPANADVGRRPENNDSLVLRVDYEDSSLLLEGDAEKKVERRIAALHHPKVDVLKVGHHGSDNASTIELLDSARPKFAVISVGFRNSFGLPRREVLGRLEDAGTRVYRTDLDGAVTFYLDGHSVTSAVAILP